MTDAWADGETAEIDAWELAGFPGRLDVAAYLTSDSLAAQYRVIVDALLDAQEHSLTGVSRDELLARVNDRIADTTDVATARRLTAESLLDLDARMKALQSWGVVIRWQDKARTEADFVRTRDRYQLTSGAADLHRWLRRTIDDDAVATSAAAFAPAVIADRLDEALLALGEGQHTAAAQAWAQVRTTLRDMADAAAIWQSRMANALAGAADEAKMHGLRETLMAYVNVWGAGVDTYSPRIRDALPRLAAVGVDDWRAIALEALDADAAEETVAAVIAAHADSVATLTHWFAESRGQATRLRRQVRDAVTPLLRGSRALLATGGRITRHAELLRIAAAVEAAKDDAAAWRVWCGATGLWAARHLSGAPPQPGGSPAGTSFWAAPPVRVEVMLRQRGARSVQGRPAQVPDRRAARHEARRAAEAERAQSAEAEAGLLARSGTRLEAWAPLGPAEAGIFFDLFTAIVRQRPDRHTGRREAHSRDGRLHVVVSPPPPGRPSAVLVTPDGHLACDNWLLELTRT